MVDRRRFLKAAAALPAALAWRPAPAASGERVALVIGNEAYRQAPLHNPGNDAQAMADLLRGAGFDVTLTLNAAQGALRSAIGEFGTAAQRAGTRQALFYYAGHGAQLDWRNYLLPVDVAVKTAAHLRERCVDLTQLLGSLAQTRGKTFMFILDACRDNPFGVDYRPEQAGLSQFDAPVGSLLAYATAPGNAASDGPGRHGLYTEHLLRELAVRGARIEDALKRVRLNVRLASHGAQIPWESTSLEGDLVLFPAPGDGRSEAEIERQLEEELTIWQAIRASTRREDWIDYLRRFPAGRFAEIAQVRLGRLLAQVEERARPLPSHPAAALPNPYSAGSHPLQRNFTVGDEAFLQQSDLLTGLPERLQHLRVTAVDTAADRVEFNGGKFIQDLMGNPLSNPRKQFDVPIQYYPAQLQVGSKWTAVATMEDRQGGSSEVSYDMHIRAMEKVTVPAGTFDAFRIEGRGWKTSKGIELQLVIWVVPGINFFIKRERTNRRGNRLLVTERQELVFLSQQGRPPLGVRP